MALKLFKVKIAGVDHVIQANSKEEAGRFGAEPTEVTAATVGKDTSKLVEANKAASPGANK